MRERIRRVVEHGLFGATVFVLILLSVGLLAWELTVPVGTPLHHALAEVQAVITGLFVVELGLRWVAGRSTRAFFRECWIDILAVLPLLRVFRLGRAFQLLRLLRLLRLPSLLDRHMRSLRYLVRVEYVLYLVLVAFVTAAGTLALAAFEERQPGAQALAHAFWVALFAVFSGEYGTGQPESLPGKFTALLLMFAGLGFFAVVTGTVSALMVEKLKEGAVWSRMNLEELEGHILVCGWNSGVETLLTELQRSSAFRETEIVVVCEQAELPELARLADPTRVRHLRDDFTRAEVLRRARVEKAAVAVIVSDTFHGRTRQDADARTVLAALTIEKLNPCVYSCAELSNAMNEPHLKMGKVDQVIITRELAGHMLAQAAIHSGAAALLKDLVQSTVGSCLVSRPVDPDLVGQKFEDVLGTVRKRHGLVALAVQRPDGTQLVNPDGYALAEGDRLLAVSSRPA